MVTSASATALDAPGTLGAFNYMAASANPDYSRHGVKEVVSVD